MSATHFRHVYGPVPSRRLGRSLGVDVVPFKVCTFDCIYCQLGRTTCKTVVRKEYARIDEVLSEVREALHNSALFDYVTVSGSGEPTLYACMDELITGLKEQSTVPVAVLTNGSLLWDRSVRRAVAKADVVIPSLDAGDEKMFRQVNRPHSELSLAIIVDGLKQFRSDFCGQLWLEVFLVRDFTDTPADVEKIARLARKVSPDRIQLNTATRPPAERRAQPVPMERLKNLCSLFEPRAEVIMSASFPEGVMPGEAVERKVCDLLARRPCTLADIAQGLAVPSAQVVKVLDSLIERSIVRPCNTKRGPYYCRVRKRVRSSNRTGAERESA